MFYVYFVYFDDVFFQSNPLKQVRYMDFMFAQHPKEKFLNFSFFPYIGVIIQLAVMLYRYLSLFTFC